MTSHPPITLQDLQVLNEKATPNVFEWDEYDELTEGNIDFIAALVNYYRSGALQRLAELAEDAERYRWLRDRPSLIGWDWWVVKVPKDIWIDGEFLDAAIDAARAPSVKEESQALNPKNEAGKS